ncbi:MAG: flagellar assembly protein FliH [Halothiobacillaceae bacterium]
MSLTQATGKAPRLLDVAGRPVITWRPPSMDAPAEAGEPSVEAAAAGVTVEAVVTPPPALPTAEEIEAIQREAWEEGYRAGHAEGLAAGQAEIEARAARWKELVDSLTQPLEATEGELETALIELALALAKQLVRRELKTQPDEIIPVVREALAALPATAREVVVHLHPEDAALVRATIHSPGSFWRIEEDGAIARGGCVVVTPTSRVDATLERRIAQLVAGVLGDDARGTSPRGVDDGSGGEVGA